MIKSFKKFPYFPRYMALKLIKIYQHTLSFDHGIFKGIFPGGFCRFQPTCSEYAYQAIEKYGLFYGGLKSAWRIMRCNPFAKGGEDPMK